MTLLQKDIDRQRDDKRKMQDEIDVAKANTKVTLKSMIDES